MNRDWWEKFMCELLNVIDFVKVGIHMQQNNLENQSDFFQLVLKGSGVSWLSDRRDEGLLAVSCQGQDHE